MLNDRENTSRRLPYEAETSEQFCDYLASVFTNVDHKHANLARDGTRCEDGENVYLYLLLDLSTSRVSYAATLGLRNVIVSAILL